MLLSPLGTLIDLLVLAGGTTLVAGYWVWDHLRGRLRNSRGQCAACARPLVRVSPIERYYVAGQLVCAPCAARLRVRLLAGFAGLVATGVLVALFVGASVYFRLRAPYPVTWGEVWHALAVVGGAILAIGTVVMGLLRANRRAKALERPDAQMLLEMRKLINDGA